MQQQAEMPGQWCQKDTFVSDEEVLSALQFVISWRLSVKQEGASHARMDNSKFICCESLWPEKLSH